MAAELRPARDTADMAARVAPDGSPVEVYRALPASPEFDPLIEALPETGSVLDLGCGVGRLSNRLVQHGYEVVAVDESIEMLNHVDSNVLTIEGRIEELRLDRQFDAVVLASNLINTASISDRTAWLSAVRSHLNPAGQAFLQRYDPQWAATVTDVEGEAGPVRVHFEVLSRDGLDFRARVTYGLGDETWIQPFQARVVDDEEFKRAIEDAGLRVERWLTSRWAAVSRA